MKNKKNKDLTIEFLKARIKTEEDLDNLSNLFSIRGKSKEDKINYIIENEIISATTLKRLFDLSYIESKNTIDNLIKNNIISLQDNEYKIISSTALKQFLIEKM